jgi:Ca2+-binding RTX toxin-like protein
VRLGCEPLEERRLLSTINWVNRGDGTDSFDTVFGANDDAARAVVDAALDAWERVIVDFNQDIDPTPGVINPNTLNITLSMSPGNTGFGGGAGAPASYDFNGHPLARAISINSGQDTSGDGNGDGVGWYLDPNPNDHSEFAGPIFNAFVGQATPTGPAFNLNDLYSLVTIEMNHALGVTNFADSGSPAWTGNPFLTNTGVADSIDNPGTLFTFSGGPSGVTALLTSNNGGPGATDTGNPLHVALPPQTNAGIPAGFSGALDVGNASGTGFPNDLRFLPSLLSSLMQSDVYGYTLATGGADVFGTMHAILNSTNGNLLVRGMTGNNNSNDVINISRSGGQLVVSVDVGADVPGTGPTGALESRFNIGSVSSITINGLDGTDTINVSGDLSFLTGAIAITGDGGNDTLTLDFGSGNPVGAGGLSFDGGTEAGTDLLVLQNGSFGTETYTATGPSSGSIALTGVPTISYSNLSPIDDTLAVTNMIFNADLTAGDVVQIEDSPNLGRGRISSGNGTFELVDYANKTNLTVNGRGGADTFNLTSIVAAPGLASLTVNGGGSTDTYNVLTTLAPTTLNGDDAGDTFHINGSNAALTVNGNAGGDTVNINDTGNGSTVTVNGGDDGDTVNVNDTGTGSSLVVNGNSDADTVNVSGNSSGVTVNGGDGGDTINVSNTGSGTIVTVNGNSDPDTINVSGTGSGGGTIVNVNGGDGGDTVNVTGTGGGGSSLTVNGNNGDDRINITGAGLAAGSNVAFNGNNDDDTFDVTSSPNVIIPVNGGLGNDTLKVNGQTLTYSFTTVAGTTTFSTPGRQDVTSVEVELLDVRNGTFTVINTVGPNVRVQGVEDGPATLNGTGVIVGTLTADSGGTVSPAVGSGVTGILGAGSTRLNAGSTFFVDLNGIVAGTDHDQLKVTGTVTINGGNLAGTLGAAYDSIPGDELVIIRNDGVDPVIVLNKFAQGDLVEIGGKKFAIDYAFDGDGDGNLNDVALIRYGAELHPDPCDPTKTALFVSATTGADNVLALPETGSSRVRIVIEAITQGFIDEFGPFDFDGQIIMMGQSGNDVVSTEAVPSRTVMLYGNVGNDRVAGGNSGGILLGNIGDDTLVGGNSQDLMIGGKGADILTGNNAGDILIAASTAYDTNTVANRQALCEILHTWQHGGRMSALINAATINDDTEVDVLTGGLGMDWFIKDANDILDATKQELTSDL